MRRRRALVILLPGCAGVALLALRLVAAPPAPPSPPPQAASFTLDLFPMGEAARRGQQVYAENCIGCHGAEGRGDGLAAAFLDPLPRDFQKGKFKFRSTPSGELPVEADLLHVVSCGLNGSAMPAFPLMPEPDKKDVVAWVRHLAEFGKVRAEVEYVMQDDHLTLAQILDGKLQGIIDEALADAWADAWPVAVPPDPGSSPERIERGHKLFQAQCVACHGAGGRGDGTSSEHLRDWKDAVIRPRDFTTGVFRAGSAPTDLFLRMRTGLNGTPMPAVAGSDDDLWALVHYIRSLRDPANAHGAVHPTSCEAQAAAGGAR
jgi:mono/diheme cytochrome c family protein